MSREARRAVIAEGLKTLKMPSVLRDYEQRARQAQDAQWDYEDYLWQLLETEIRDREARTVERRLRAARFPDHKTLEQIDFKALQGVSKPKLRELAACDYIDRGDDVVLVGPIGTGKEFDVKKAQRKLRRFVEGHSNAGWEKRSIFLNFLVSKLPAPQEEDLSRGILDAIDTDSYRVEKQAMQKILLPDEEAEIDPVPTTGGAYRPEPELDHLSNIIKVFNDHFGGIDWEDADRVQRLIAFDIPSRVAADTAFRNARQNSDKENTRLEHDKALLRVMRSVMKDDTELFKQFMDNESFKQWMSETVFRRAYDQAGAP